ncbi:polysaccharide pyruvyl transferase family protein [Subtercola boreus]|uniref:polysaccharide pyruvyl transferase family protein n=1 Tax=Subtercola boreus TaxID=120213 RepID=UPI001559A535|nr:polysaccharide pyruvyl transferase family protein [Subtercola boreus]
MNWNPREPRLPGRIGRKFPIGPRKNNFGDLLGPKIVERLLAINNLVGPTSFGRSKRLLTVGSIMHFARNGDVVWGTGINGKVDPSLHRYARLDVRAVRGPLTRNALMKRGIGTPEVFGDPGLLVGHIWPRSTWAPPEVPDRVLVIPNLNDHSNTPSDLNPLSPRSPLLKIIGRIAHAELVVGSSLHAIVLADSLGVPARLVRSPSEAMFKYEDYYYGSGRSSFSPASSVSEAVRLGGEDLLEWDAQPLLGAFPLDLWGKSE